MRWWWGGVALVAFLAAFLGFHGARLWVQVAFPAGRAGPAVSAAPPPTETLAWTDLDDPWAAVPAPPSRLDLSDRGPLRTGAADPHAVPEPTPISYWFITLASLYTLSVSRRTC